ncbi:unnamed protein product, partial [Mesorhabditis belari]|uniref:Uncharacterized protein n=1 Tax=Mesorhabditis belari TaxID=2138241 RepID=A0AAF3ENF3_9BILA
MMSLELRHLNPNPAFVPEQARPHFKEIVFSLLLMSIRKYMVEVNCWMSCRRWLLDELNGHEKSANERFADPCECKKPLEHYGDDCTSAMLTLTMMTGTLGPNLLGMSHLEPGETRHIEMLQGKTISFSDFFIEMRRYMVTADCWEECQDDIADLNETDLSATLSWNACSCPLLAGKEDRLYYELYLIGATMCDRI